MRGCRSAARNRGEPHAAISSGENKTSRDSIVSAACTQVRRARSVTSPNDHRLTNLGPTVGNRRELELAVASEDRRLRLRTGATSVQLRHPLSIVQEERERFRRVISGMRTGIYDTGERVEHSLFVIPENRPFGAGIPLTTRAE
jgi:hypothetical protein